MEDLLALVEKHLGKSWLDVVDRLQDLNQLDDIEARVRAGDKLGAIQGIQDAAATYATDIHTGYVAAGQTTAKWLDEQVAPVIRFDATNTQAVAWAQKNKLELVQGLSAEQQQTVRNVIAQGVSDGRNPREVAKDLRGSIGLTPNQADAVASYRKALEAGDFSNALGRELSGGHSDRSIAAARDAGRSLPPEQIDLAVDRYRKNQLAWRAETIARTEGLRAVHAGNAELFRQAIAKGDVDADQLVGQWHPGPKTKNARPDHRAQSLLSQRPAFGEPFDMPDGTQMQHPGDEAGGAANNANCRCTKSTRFAA